MVNTVHDIDEAFEQEGRGAPPLVRLVNLLMRECLKADASACLLEQNNERGVAILTKPGLSREVMAFPIPVFEALVEFLASLAGFGETGAVIGDGSMAIRWHGTLHTIGFSLSGQTPTRYHAMLRFGVIPDN